MADLLAKDESAWRVGHNGQHSMFYEEAHRGAWRRLPLDGEMLTGRAHHVIYFGSRADWRRMPAWAHGRRDEIIGRVKEVFRIPDYEYEGEGVMNDHDWALLIEAAGGLSENACCFADCQERALKSTRVCVRHVARRAS